MQKGLDIPIPSSGGIGCQGRGSRGRGVLYIVGLGNVAVLRKRASDSFWFNNESTFARSHSSVQLAALIGSIKFHAQRSLTFEGYNGMAGTAGT